MNEACTFEAAEALLREQRPLEGVLTLLASRSKKSARELSAPVEEVFRGASTTLDQMLTSLIEKRSADEFDAGLAYIFPKYAALTISISQIAKAIVPEDVLERLTREAICELEADFRDQATAAFGSAIKEQAMFTIWTVRKISEIVTKIHSTKIVDDTKKKEDEEFSGQFIVCSLYGHLSLDCLRIALKQNRPIYPEVMGRVTEGLRAMVNAYTWARRGLALRIRHTDEAVESDDQGEGDEALIRHSMNTFYDLDDGGPLDGA